MCAHWMAALSLLLLLELGLELCTHHGVLGSTGGGGEGGKKDGLWEAYLVAQESNFADPNSLLNRLEVRMLMAKHAYKRGLVELCYASIKACNWCSPGDSFWRDFCVHSVMS